MLQRQGFLARMLAAGMFAAVLAGSMAFLGWQAPLAHDQIVSDE